jgi:Sulfotransferase domain
LTTEGSMDFPHIAEFCPWFEKSLRSARGFELRPSPRIFKSHLPYPQIPKGPGKYIYVARDGKDVAVSNYHLHRTYLSYEGTFAEFFNRFLRGKIGYGSWFQHVAGWWAHRHDPNVLFLTYEELTRDLAACLRRIIAFCGLKVSLERFPVILQRCHFDFMKKHESQFDPAIETFWELGVRLNSFLRAGRVGDGAVYLNRQQQERFERAYHRYLEDTGFATNGAVGDGPR